MSFNKVILVGRLTRDPELKLTKSGTAVCNMSLALNSTYFNKETKERENNTTFVDVQVWKEQGENVQKYLTKGSECLVEGSLAVDKWVNAEGENRQKMYVVGHVVKFLSTPSKEGKSEEQEELFT